MKKIALDLAEFARGSTQVMLVADTGDDWVYPIDVDSTLQDEARFYSSKDENDGPIRRCRSVGGQYNPTRISGFAFGHCNSFRQHGKDMNRKTFLKGARWMSCIAQGEGMTVLTRAAVLTTRAALEPLKHDIRDGGVRSRLPKRLAEIGYCLRHHAQR